MIAKERLRILKGLDVDAALKHVATLGFIPDTREIALAGLHKARCRQPRYFTREELKASRDWLEEHGYGQ